MAAPATPRNFYAQAGNGTIYLSWDMSTGATSYTINRSNDGITYVVLDTSTVPSFYDDTAVVGTQYWYTVQSDNGELSIATEAVTSVAVREGVNTLGSLRLQAQQRADRVNSNFVTKPEWNTYINQSALELYDLLITVYEDYYLAPKYVFLTDGSTAGYTLPNGVLVGTDGVTTQPFYKLMGVDMGISNSENAKVTVHKYDFIERNRYVYPNVASTYFGVFNLRYRVMGSKIHFIPTPSAGQYLTLHYIPRLATLLADSDTLDTISGWDEYIIVDAAIKALQKEESDVSVLMAQKQMLIDRIQSSAMNRDAGEPDTVSNSRLNGYGNGWGGSDGGYNGGY